MSVLSREINKQQREFCEQNPQTEKCLKMDKFNQEGSVFMLIPALLILVLMVVSFKDMVIKRTFLERAKELLPMLIIFSGGFFLFLNMTPMFLNQFDPLFLILIVLGFVLGAFSKEDKKLPNNTND